MTGIDLSWPQDSSSLPQISSRGAEILAEILKKNDTLIIFNIGYNNIGDNGAFALAKALTNNSKLITLELIQNNIGDKGVIALAETLKTNDSLKKINLSCNNIDVKGATELANALTNSKLTNLLLYDNLFDKRPFGEKNIKDLIRKNRQNIPESNKILDIDLFWEWNDEKEDYDSVFV